jgi:hypothetical protein
MVSHPKQVEESKERDDESENIEPNGINEKK